MHEQNPCTGCGLCCDGTLLSWVPIEDGDNPAIFEVLGVRDADEYGGAFFEQPCTALKSRCCSIYSERPATCRRYRCLMLRDFEAAKLTYEEARALVEQAVSLRDRILPQIAHCLEAEVLMPFPRLFRLMVAKLDKVEGGEHAGISPELLLEVGALRIFLARHFDSRLIHAVFAAREDRKVPDYEASRKATAACLPKDPS